MKSIQNDFAFLISITGRKGLEKQKLIRIFCDNHWFYIRCLAKQYEQASTSLTLTQLVTKNLGVTGSGYLTRILLKYALDPIDYFCQVLTDLGSKHFDKNKAEIARIFLARSELDLNEIRSHFAANYNSKGLVNWIRRKSKGSKFGFFLICILESIDGAESLKHVYHHQQQVLLKQPTNEQLITFNPSIIFNFDFKTHE